MLVLHAFSAADPVEAPPKAAALVKEASALPALANGQVTQGERVLNDEGGEGEGGEGGGRGRSLRCGYGSSGVGGGRSLIITGQKHTTVG